MTKFIGREKELDNLRLLLKKQSASFVVIRGRRRIGKSRLIQEFGKDLNCHVITGLPPTKKATRKSQLKQFCLDVAESFGQPKFEVENWGEVFTYLGKLCSGGPVLLALDEISWIGSKDSDFLGHLKNAWDRSLSTNPELILIVCGSVSSWIEQNILSATGFLGRISLDMRLEELPVADSAKFWGSFRDRVSPHEILKTLSVTGGIPRYLEDVLPELPAEENIRRLGFLREGLLYREFDNIFSDLFASHAPTFIKIVEKLAAGPQNFATISQATKISRRGTLLKYLRDLVQAGFVTEEPAWNLKSLKQSQAKRYRLSDNYLRFYLRTILPNQNSIEKGLYEKASVLSLPAWDAIMGLQFENLVLNNTFSLFKSLGINPSDILRFGPYFQNATTRHQGCQVDLLIQTRYRTLYLCEIKFSQTKVGMDVVHAIKAKQKNIAIQRGWSTRLVLVHVNGLTRDAEQAGTLDHIVDFSKWLEQ